MNKQFEIRGNKIFKTGTYNEIAIICVQKNYEDRAFIPIEDVEANAYAKVMLDALNCNSLPNFSAEKILLEKNLFEDFTTLKWVKWTKRKPTWNGTCYFRWNGKYISNGRVHSEELMSLDGKDTEYEIISQQLIVKYTDSQKAIMEDLYWLEETYDLVGMERYQEELSELHFANAMPIMKIGDVVKPKPDSGFVLRSGAEAYSAAVVISVEPFILTSEDATMKWQSTIVKEYFEVTGSVSEDILQNCMRRLN